MSGLAESVGAFGAGEESGFTVGDERRRLRGAEDLHGQRCRGEVHDRFVEIGETVEVRQEIVVRRRHLARHFGVAALVRVEKLRAA